MRTRWAVAVATLVLAAVAVTFVWWQPYATEPTPPRDPVPKASRAPPIGVSEIAPQAPSVVDDPKRAGLKRAGISNVSAFNDYQTRGDLRKVYDELRPKRDAGSLFATSRILAECAQTRGPFSLIGKIAERRVHSVLNKPLTDSQILAAQDIVMRCKGFASLLPADLINERNFLAERSSATGDVFSNIYSGIPAKDPLTDDQIRELLVSQDPVGIMLSAPTLVARWKLATQSSDQKNLALANDSFVAIACDLGMACGPDSLRTRTACIFNAALCGLDVKAQELYWLSPADQSKFEDLRIGFLQAIRSGDFRLFGF